MKSPVLHIVAVVITALFPTVEVFAYPISPVTLWDLVETSSLIVLADVISVDDPRAGEMPDHDDPNSIMEMVSRDATAHLNVREVWKGNWAGQLQVSFEDMLVCPAPARYMTGGRVLAFLHRDEGAWRTTSLSYGTLYPQDDGIPIFRSLVARAVRLQAAASVSDDAYMNWIVDAASHPATRWHGLYPLIPRSDILHSRYDKRTGISIIDRLTDQHLARIAEGFIASPPTDRTLPMALAALASYSSERLDMAALASMEAVMSSEPVPWWAKDALRHLLERFMARSVVESTLEDLEDWPDESDSDEIRAIWKRTKEELGLPDVEPAEITQPEMWGVGSNTPS